MRYDLDPERMLVGYLPFVGCTLAFLLVFLLVNKQPRPLASRFVVWGIWVVILSVGYALIGAPALTPLTSVLARTGFLLVLGGLAASLLARGAAGAETQETDRV
jgi:FtsH-binding integral membrane protein